MFVVDIALPIGPYPDFSNMLLTFPRGFLFFQQRQSFLLSLQYGCLSAVFDFFPFSTGSLRRF
jgi:hypothetical protein